MLQHDRIVVKCDYNVLEPENKVMFWTPVPRRVVGWRNPSGWLSPMAK